MAKSNGYISLYWDDCEYHPYYIKKHISLEEAVDILNREQEITPVRVLHKYGRLVRIGPDHEDSIDGLESTFRVIDTPRKSYYPVTECWTHKENEVPDESS